MNIHEPKYQINISEVKKGNRILEDITCLMCSNLGTIPMSCDQCDAIMCYDCIGKYKQTEKNSGKKDICPACK